jgi:hypothetical protein
MYIYKDIQVNWLNAYLIFGVKNAILPLTVNSF